MPKKSNRLKKACNSEVKATTEEHRETKLFNSSSDETYSMASDALSLVDGLNWEIEHRIKKNEMSKFINSWARISVFGDAKGNPSVIGLIASIETDEEKHLQWLVIENATARGKFHDKIKIEVGEVVLIEEDAKTAEDSKVCKDLSTSTFSASRESSTSGYDSHATQRASRSTMTTPTKWELADRQRSKSQEARGRIYSGPSRSPDIIGSYAAVLKGAQESNLVPPKLYPILRDSSFPPLIPKEDEKLIQGKSRPPTPNSITIPRPNTPMPKPETQPPGVLQLDITVTGSDGIRRKMYPSLPSEETTAVPDFMVNEPVQHFNPPPPSFLPRWGTPPKMYEDDNEGEKKAKFSKKAELRSMFTKFAQRRLKKEHETAIRENRGPDFHYALHRACDLTEIKVDEAELRNIKIQPNCNLAHEDVLEKFFQLILVLPSTQVPQHLETDIFSDFTQNRPTMMIRDRKTGQLLYPIKYTEEGFVDELFMKATWRKFSPELKFREWMGENEILSFMLDHDLELKNPNCFSVITNEGFRMQIRSNWEQDFRKNEIQFHHWLPKHLGWSQNKAPEMVQLEQQRDATPVVSSSSSEHVPHTSESSNETPILSHNSSPIPASQEVSHQENASLSQNEIMSQTFNAYEMMGKASENERPVLQEMFHSWTKDNYTLSFKEFVKKKKEERRLKAEASASSGEVSLADQLRRMVINPDANPNSYQSLQSTTESEVDYDDSGLTDLSQKTPEEWTSFFRRMSIRLPVTVSDEITQSILIEGNMREGISIDLMSTITPQDFLSGGKYAHVFIPNYVYIPPDITADLNFTYERLHNHYFILWRRLYAARFEAQKLLERELLKQLKTAHETKGCPWIDLLLDYDIAKSFHFDEIDILQMSEALRSIPGQKVHVLRNRQFYDRFFRPLERLFAFNMPLRDRLFYAMESCDATEDLTGILLKYVGIPTLPLNLSPRFVTEELSRIRHLRMDDFAPRSTLDAPLQLVGAVNLKSSHHRRYQHDSDRMDEKKLLKQLGRETSGDETANDNLDQYFNILNEAIADCREEMEVIRNQIQENFNLVSRTTSEVDKRECLNNISVLKDRQSLNETSYNKQWKTYEELLHKRAKNRHSSDEESISLELDQVSSSKSVLSTYIISWKEKRQELTKEKFGISVCLSKAIQNKKSTPTQSDVDYRRTLLERQVEIECQIKKLTEKIEQGEERCSKIKNEPPPTLPPLEDWSEDPSEEYWNQYFPKSQEVAKKDPPPIPRKKILPQHEVTTQTWSGNNQGEHWKGNSQRSSTSDQVYLKPPAVKSQTYFSKQTPHWTKEERKVNYRPQERLTRNASPVTWTGSQASEQQVENWPKAASAQRRAAREWHPIPFPQLPTVCHFWDGQNLRSAPKWATKTNSILDVANNWENFTTKKDIVETDNQFLLKITSANGVNFDTRLEIKMGVNSATMMPETVVVYETSTDRMTGYKQIGTIPLPAFQLMSILLAMEDLMAKPFPPVSDDRFLTEMTLFSTDFIEYAGPRITFQLQLQLVSVTGTAGTERMVRLKLMESPRDNIVQFPWVHLPRIHRLWWSFHEDAKKQIIDNRKSRN